MRIAVVVPTYNEADNLRELASRVLALDPPIQLVCVDDASPDGTGEIADQITGESDRFIVIHRTGPRGYSAACREGLGWCLNREFDVIGTMDADLSHEPERLPALIAAIEAGADLAIGSRYVDGGHLVVEWGPFRRAVSRAGSGYAHFMVGTGTRDCTSGFRLYRSSALRSVSFAAIHSEGYSFLIETLAQLSDVGACVVEVPITYEDRHAGASKISRRIIWEALVLTTELGISRLIGARRKRRASTCA